MKCTTRRRDTIRFEVIFLEGSRFPCTTIVNQYSLLKEGKKRCIRSEHFDGKIGFEFCDGCTEAWTFMYREPLPFPNEQGGILRLIT